MVLIRYLTLAFIGLVPIGSLRKWLYHRLLGFRFGRGARVGMLNFLDVRELQLEEDAAIVGFGNVFLSVNRVLLRSSARIGAPRIGLNLFRGTANKKSYPQSQLVLGHSSRIELMHYFDMCADILIGNNVVIGGIKSVFFTHTFHKPTFEPIVIGDDCYIGSNCLFQMGAQVPARSVVGMGSVVTQPLSGDNPFIAGVPARVVRNGSGYDARQAYALRNLRYFEASTSAQSSSSEEGEKS